MKKSAEHPHFLRMSVLIFDILLGIIYHLGEMRGGKIADDVVFLAEKRLLGNLKIIR